MDGRERFKVAVLAICADHGLSLGETLLLVKEANHARMEKQAAGGLGAAVQGGLNMSKGLMNWMLLSLALAPPAAGAMGGWGLAKATSGLNDQTSAEVKHREMIEELRRQADRARAQTELARQRNERGKVRGRSLI
jgi:hypothetical protein